MNTASLELCKELYELSGWGDTLLRHPIAKTGLESALVVRTVYDKHVSVQGTAVGCDECEGEYGLETLPAYDLGYLLRKLDGFDVQLNYSNQWRRWYCWNNTGAGEVLFADTPEDAAVKLAIELFKSGVLKEGKQ